MHGIEINKLKEILDNEHYYECSTSDQEFLSICNGIGTPIPSRKHSGIIDTLIPKLEINAHPNSLSSIHGINRFPFHTDGAYLDYPPKYIALRYCDGIKEPTPTEILPIICKLSKEELTFLRLEMWSVRGRNQNFYSSILTDTPDGSNFILRYDRGCMKPVDKISTFENIVDSQSVGRTLIDWHPGKTLILNNWKVLHARPDVKAEEINNRKLQRILINEQ